MWIVIKFKKQDFQLLKSEIEKKLKNNFDYYLPKMNYEKIVNNKVRYISKYITDDYLFANIKDISKNDILMKLRYFRGVKYILDHFKCSQIDIENFIKRCKSHEDESGNLKISFFDSLDKDKIKFLNGPFVDQIMNIIVNKKKFMKTTLNNFNLTVKKKNNFFLTVS